MADPILHTKPTQEELQANVDKAIEDAEKLKDTPEEETQEEETTEVIESEEKPEEKTEEVPEEKTEDEKEEVAEEEKTEDKKQEIEKRYSESTREAQILHLKNKKMQEAVEQAGQLPEPTDEDMKVEYPEWDDMTASEQKTARKSVWNEKKFSYIDSVNEESKNIDAWNKKTGDYVDDPKTLIDHPELEGMQDEFKLFLNKPSRRGLELEDLTKIFLFDTQSQRAKAGPKKGQMFERGSGGPNDKQKAKSDKLSVAESKVLMKTDYKKYTEYLNADKISEEIE